MENQTGMRLRSQVTTAEKEATKLEQEERAIKITDRPFIKFPGKLYYYTSFVDCATACDKLINFVNNNLNAENQLVLGFDMEWSFSFQTGPYKTALIQINPNLDECYLFHVYAMNKLPMTLIKLLEHPNARWAGVNIKNDFRKLARDFPGIDDNFIVENCIDCRTQANDVLPNRRQWSMEKLVAHFFKMQINKDPKIRKSKWNVLPLSNAQIEYAAIDSYVSLKLYHHLKELERANKENVPT